MGLGSAASRIGLGNHHAENTHADSARNVRRILQYGAVYYDRDPAPWNFTEVMFPITPLELREGMVLGEERVHTAKSGRFGWPDGSAADIYVIDAQGARAKAPDVTEVKEDSRRIYEIRMPSDHFPVLVKRDQLGAAVALPAIRDENTCHTAPHRPSPRLWRIS